MCNCRTWCRDWRETQGGKYAASNHAPDCEDYKLEKFVRIELDGSFCIVEPKDVADILADDYDMEGNYKIEDVMLTRDQFEALPEFEGF